MAGSGCPRVPTSRELHACDLLGGRGKLARIDNTGLRFTPEQRAEILMDGLRIIENAAHWPGGIEVDNVCLRKANVKGYERSVWTGCSTASTRPFIFPNSSPDHRVCNFLTPLPVSSRRPSLSIGGFELSYLVCWNCPANGPICGADERGASIATG